MLILLRIVFGVALIYQLMEGGRSAPGTGEAGDLTGAYYLVVCVFLAILNALVWAPYLGAKVSGPLTGMITESTFVEGTNWVLRLIRWLDARRSRRAVTLLCFLEGIRHPAAPSAFVVGLNNARPGSWLEKVYAREVFRFNNTTHCVQAYLALKRHDIDPRPHPSQEVNIVLLSLERPARPDPAPMAVPAAPRPGPLKRNPRIRLFRRSGAEEPARSPAEPVAQDPVPPSGTAAEAPQSAAPPSSPRDVPGGKPLTGVLVRIVSFLRVP